MICTSVLTLKKIPFFIFILSFSLFIRIVENYLVGCIVELLQLGCGHQSTEYNCIWRRSDKTEQINFLYDGSKSNTKNDKNPCGIEDPKLFFSYFSTVKK